MSRLNVCILLLPLHLLSKASMLPLQAGRHACVEGLQQRL